MAKKIRKTKKIRRTNRNTPKIEAKSEFFNRIKLTESYTSLILGAIAVLIFGILFIFFAKGNRNMQTSSTSDVENNSNTSSTYTIKPGDDLWTISENIYNDGYKWVEIAKLNKLENPGLIYSGDKLEIPSATSSVGQKKIVSENITPSPQVQNSIIQSNSITRDTYTVVKGDNLWDIAVRAYGDGFKWPEIAEANNLSNPNLIHSGNVFKIPR